MFLATLGSFRRHQPWLTTFSRQIQASAIPITSQQLDTPSKHPSHDEKVFDNVTEVYDTRSAALAVDCLMSLPPETLVAWDTETTGVNPAKQSPVDRGRIICATAFAGDAVDFGNGPRLFIDCLEEDNNQDVLKVFKPYFENKTRKKVWHNYAFDRHMLANHGINTMGFGGDTMHMARLVDSSLPKYALEALCSQFLQSGLDKRNLETRFGEFEEMRGLKKSDFTIHLQRNPQTRPEWIDYATMDAELTHRLCYILKSKLELMQISGVNSMPAIHDRFENMYELYTDVLLPFGELLTDMERTGFKVDLDWLKKAETQADQDRIKLEDQFLEWAQKQCPDARYMNVNSDPQKQQLLFAPCKNSFDPKLHMPPVKSFNIELKGRQKDLYLTDLKNKEDDDSKEEYNKLMDPKKKGKVKVDIVLKGLGKGITERTAKGWPSVSAKTLQTLAGKPYANPPRYGYPEDPEMCRAVADLINATSISTLISTFIIPLQQWPGYSGRIHASLNLNTETGRISSRRPNLQNQPALEKDRYKVRQAFSCEEGNTLIVADYSQLELRLLAHITKCHSMIDAFKAGGDFHSRTAMTMFDNVSKAVEKGECVLERDSANSTSDSIPLLKDMFSVERRKAKTLNFSIAYGKTVMGLARDWNVSREEASETLMLWYKERQEVLQWQRECKKFLAKNQYVETLLGRRRHLPDIANHDFRLKGHAERAAINAPLQGSAADLVMAAMVKLNTNRVLKALGWKIILQVHDEIILEGPEESAAIVLPLIKTDMQNPIDVPLRVDLTVDAQCAKTWYAAK